MMRQILEFFCILFYLVTIGSYVVKDIHSCAPSFNPRRATCNALTHGRLYRWTENSFPFFLDLKPVEISKKCFFWKKFEDIHSYAPSFNPRRATCNALTLDARRRELTWISMQSIDVIHLVWGGFFSELWMMNLEKEFILSIMHTTVRIKYRVWGS